MKQSMTMVLGAALSAGLLALSVPAPAQAPRAAEGGFVHPEGAVENASVRFYLQSDLSGTAVARECPGCAPMRLRVTPAMQVIVNGQPIEWDQALDLSAGPVEVYYLLESRSIARIVVP